MFKNRQSKDVKPHTKGTKSESDFRDDSQTSNKDTKTANTSSKGIKPPHPDKTSSSQTHSSTPDTTGEVVKTYTLTNILDLARSTAEMDFTTPDLRELILDMKAWLARVKSQVERKHRKGLNGKGEASADAELRKGERERGHLLILAEIGSIIYRLEERLRRRERFGGEMRFRGKMVRRRAKGLFGRLKGRLGCERDRGSGRDGI
jgi:hypothetical protein